MRAVRWHAREDVRLDVVAEPVITEPHELILAVEACGICGTDVEEYAQGPVSIPVDAPHPLTGMKAPITLGHEIVGRVVDAGTEAVFASGQRLAASPVIGCGVCLSCLDGADQRCSQLAVVGLSMHGGLAEYVAVDSRKCAEVADGVAADRAALVEPYSVALHAVGKAGPVAGLRAAVIGAGAVGCCIIEALYLLGAEHVSVFEPRTSARERAVGLGATAVDTACLGRTEATTVFEVSGSREGLGYAVEAAAPGGGVVVVGFRPGHVPVCVKTVVFRELSIRGSVGQSMSEFSHSARLISEGKIGSALGPVEWCSLEDVGAKLASARTGQLRNKVLARP